MLLDTGSQSGLLIKRSMAEAVDWLTSGDLEPGMVRGVNGIADVERTRLNSMQIGPYELTGVRVTIPAAGEALPMLSRGAVTRRGSRRGKPQEGILGYDVLRDFVLTLTKRLGWLAQGSTIDRHRPRLSVNEKSGGCARTARRPRRAICVRHICISLLLVFSSGLP